MKTLGSSLVAALLLALAACSSPAGDIDWPSAATAAQSSSDGGAFAPGQISERASDAAVAARDAGGDAKVTRDAARPDARAEADAGHDAAPVVVVDAAREADWTEPQPEVDVPAYHCTGTPSCPDPVDNGKCEIAPEYSCDKAKPLPGTKECIIDLGPCTSSGCPGMISAYHCRAVDDFCLPGWTCGPQTDADSCARANGTDGFGFCVWSPAVSCPVVLPACESLSADQCSTVAGCSLAIGER